MTSRPHKSPKFPSMSNLCAWPVSYLGFLTSDGKTLAAFVAALDLLWRTPRREAGVRILYVSPRKALNEDIRRNLEVPLAGILERSPDCGPPLSPLQAAVRGGETPARDRARLVRKPPDILITGQNRDAIRLARSLGSKLPSLLIASRFPLHKLRSLLIASRFPLVVCLLLAHSFGKSAIVMIGNDTAATGSRSYAALRRISTLRAARTQVFSSGVSGLSVAFASSFLAS